MEPVSSFLQSPLISPVVWCLALTALGIFFWHRSKSTYALLERCWRVIAGKVDVSNPQLRELIETTRDLEKFRFMFGIKVESKRELAKLMSWLENNSIYIGTAQKAKNWINIKSPDVIYLPGKSYVVLLMVAVVLLWLLALAAMVVSTSNYSLYRMKKSEVWFLSDGSTFKSLTQSWSVNKESCVDQAKLAKAAGFEDFEVKLVCQAVGDGSFQATAAKSLKFQKSAAAVAVICIVLYLLKLIRNLISASAAIDICKKIKQKRQETE